MLTPKRTVYIITVPSLVAFIGWNFLFSSSSESLICWKDYENDEQTVCRPKCDYGYFSLPWMGVCRPWLTCQELVHDVHIENHLGNGAVKIAYLAKYENYDVVYLNPTSSVFMDDFKHGKVMLRELNPSKLVVQLIGMCRNTIVTQYHKLGTAANLNRILGEGPLAKYNTLETRFKLCVNYAEILSYLHNSPAGIRVMCDSNDLQKTLSQFLLTDDLRIVVNDVDALPQINQTSGKGIKCGHRELFGDFVAPEQLWPFPDKEFVDEEMPLYNEKTDIWKVPDVCNYFLASVDGADNIKFHLFKIHQKCKSINPKDRPTAADIVYFYKSVMNKLDL